MDQMQTGAGATLLSIAVLASFILGGAGMWMIGRKRDVKKGVLMLAAALVLLGNVLILTAPI